MKALSSGDLVFIVEDFLCEYLNLDLVRLKRKHITLLEELYKDYGVEVGFIPSNSVRNED